MRFFKACITLCLSSLLISCNKSEDISEDNKSGENEEIKNEDKPGGESNQKKEYTISFYNGDTLLKSDTVEQGKKPTYSEIPTKDVLISEDGKTKTTYTFAGWYKDNPNAQASDAIQTSNLPVVSADAKYYAIFSETKAYLVTFNNGDNELSSSFVISGSVPTYNGTTPEKAPKENNGQFTRFSFIGWNTDPQGSPDSTSTKTDLVDSILEPTDYYAIFRGIPTIFAFDKTVVELDCQDSSASKIGKHNGVSISGLTYHPYFDKTVSITATTNEDASNYNVDWSISSDDTAYFSLQTNTDNPFEANVTALKPSRLATLTAKFTNKNTNQIEGTVICQLRSVVTSVYSIAKYTETNINGIDVSSSTNSGNAYHAFMFSPEGWGNNYDFVFPSKLNLSSSTDKTYSTANPVSKIFTLGNTDGNGKITNVQRNLRNLFIPNTVVEIDSYFFDLLKGNIIFEGGGANLIRFTYGTGFYKALNSNYVKEFPYNEYATGTSTSFTSVSSIENFKPIFQNDTNTMIIVHKK